MSVCRPRFAQLAIARKGRPHAIRSFRRPQVEDAPFLEPFVRTFILGVGTGALLEGAHVACQLLAGSFPGVSHYSPLVLADHVTALASWILLYTVEAVAVMAVLKRFNYDAAAAAKDIRGASRAREMLRTARMGRGRGA